MNFSGDFVNKFKEFLKENLKGEKVTVEGDGYTVDIHGVGR